MKKLQLCILGSLFAASLQAQSTDYTKGLSIWFDTPNNLDGRASWYSPATDKAWENNSLPIGNGSLGGNVMGSIAAERITLNEKTLWRGGPNTEKGAAYYWNVRVSTPITRNPPSIYRRQPEKSRRTYLQKFQRTSRL